MSDQQSDGDDFLELVVAKRRALMAASPLSSSSAAVGTTTSPGAVSVSPQQDTNNDNASFSHEELWQTILSKRRSLNEQSQGLQSSSQHSSLARILQTQPEGSGEIDSITPTSPASITQKPDPQGHTCYLTISRNNFNRHVATKEQESVMGLPATVTVVRNEDDTEAETGTEDASSPGDILPIRERGPDDSDVEFGRPLNEKLAVAVEVEESSVELLPSAVKYDPIMNANPPVCNNRRSHLYAFLAFVILVVAVVATASGVMLAKQKEDQLASTMSAPTSYRETRGIEAKIKSVVGSDVLQDPASAYAKALQWITFDDPMQLLPEAANFIQRYTAAQLYFATTENGSSWKSCNPPADAWSGETFCVWNKLGNDPMSINTFVWANIPAMAFLSNSSECNWAGLECDDQGQVRSVELPGAGLSGTFPEGIRNWPFLQEISFTTNNLRGPLPAHLLSEMKHLVSIRLSYNQFTGPIPDEWWTASRNLETLDLKDNRVTGTISTLIGNLRDLKNLYLGENRLSGVIPSQIGLLDNVLDLDLSRNSLTGEIPTSIGNLVLVKDLWLTENQLVGPIPRSIGKLTTLTNLNLHINFMTGELPDSLYELANLEVLDLSDCGFSGTLSPKIANFGDNLLHFRISNNMFHGSIPPEFAALSNLGTLWLQGNAFTGTFPDKLCSYQTPSNEGAYEPVSALEDVKADCSPNGEGYVVFDCSCCTECCKPGGTDCSPSS